MSEVVNAQTVLLVISITSSILALVCLRFVFVLGKKLQDAQGQTAQLSSSLQGSEQQIAILRSEVAELRASIMSIGKRVVATEQELNDVANQQAAQKYDDPDAKMYSRAVKMVELGADIEEVMRECELPRAEAELLMSLHNKSK
ncbi:MULTISPECIES: DUF2802 domain-containing protein [Pseudoalteromonas]|uniref:DUF2802 domain-containing protein n=1 Tax=Pseudoalteromonas maricaloris TaxID=184924 RepID=A0A8I2GZJ2_9GAMM|nr:MULTISPECIES: DUF2802 domain-containing protein [Pseudoalteromonas]KID38132.1 hypothetical protein QT15_05035 [Pseudoalteromonas flavipulchra NCIMB 2033 = ATCC BAA-314]MBD0782693.1 DUF2802 domain-containing protein [Pseudoalteromonas flavipulchra]MCG7538616.1 DUF2802 domain-containing protein [Pseudoalteromonas sp. OF7H-1]NLR20578.1 DUF2802 domain-containing protein [Pseudoalteromonas maricaloris]QUI63046.1 DUF2802 domain-containing protein [Pseudoalteromonas sp. A22]